jgi:hypothetical protein
VGVVLGLLAGLAMAVGVALYMSRTSTQLSDKTRRPPERVLETLPGQELPDPNRHAQTVKLPQTEPPVAPPEPAAPAPVTAASETPQAPVGSESTDPNASNPQQPGSADPALGAAPAAPVVPAAPVAPEVDKSTYVLQVGAFKGQEDAESMKGKLALVGFEARIQTAEVNGVTFYRVRVGPFGQLDDMNRARNRLAENGIEASVVRQR